MPLPENNTPWPPAGPQTTAMAEWSAWYSGDPDQLAGFYGPIGATTARPAQFSGGVVGRIARWWWGVPTSEGEQRSKLHVPLAADICATSADLLFSESPNLTSEDDKFTEWLGQLQADGLDSTLTEAAEVAAAMGGVYLRTVWDTEVSPMPWTEIAHPDGAVPTFRRGRLQSVNLWTELPKHADGVVHRLVEHHELGAIQYGLYEGTASNLGKLVPLLEHPEAAHLANLVGVDGVTQETGISRLTVSYVPNMLPNRLDRRSEQGRSDLAGVTPLLDALDEAYSSWWRDIRVGKARLHVPAQYLESTGPGSAAQVDLDREVYVPLEGVLARPGEGLMIDAQQFKIRVEEHSRTCQEWTEAAIEHAGYTPPSKSGDQGGNVTATEVNSKDRRTNMTRGKKIRYWTAGIRAHLQAQAEIANANLRAGLTLSDVKVEFQDGVQESALALAQTVAALRNAESASAETRVRMLHSDWTQEQVDTEVGLILSESGGAPVPVPNDAGF